jgi:zinc D-Ala-D-Ala carboxypeptidase
MTARVRLSPNFYLHEYLLSTEAARIGREVEAGEREVFNLRRLSLEVMEPIRTHLDNRAITVLSGFRPPWLNALANGSEFSEHMDARAADVIVHGLSAQSAFRGIATIVHRLPINQLILEFNRWVHVSVSANGLKPKRQMLVASWVDGKKVYTPYTTATI